MCVEFRWRVGSRSQELTFIVKADSNATSPQMDKTAVTQAPLPVCWRTWWFPVLRHPVPFNHNLQNLSNVPTTSKFFGADPIFHSRTANIQLCLEQKKSSKRAFVSIKFCDIQFLFYCNATYEKKRSIPFLNSFGIDLIITEYMRRCWSDVGKLTQSWKRAWLTTLVHSVQPL